jgi:hypothetical protein
VIHNLKEQEKEKKLFWFIQTLPKTIHLSC